MVGLGPGLVSCRSKGQELFTSGGSRSGSKKEVTPNLTKKTLDAIRQLWSSGQLSLAQKTKLIYSVVRSTKEEEVSEVRIAKLTSGQGEYVRKLVTRKGSAN